MVTDVDPASLRVTWQPPPLIDQNGPLVGYTISYHRTDDFSTAPSMGATGNETIISGLDPFVSYSVQVSARNDKGLGIASSIINQVSGQDGKYNIYICVCVSVCVGVSVCLCVFVNDIRT